MTSTTFSAVGTGTENVAKSGDIIAYALSVEDEATFDATINLLFSDNNGATWALIASFTEAVDASINAPRDGLYKFFCDAFGETGDDVTAEITVTTVPQTLEEWYAAGGVRPLTVKEDGIETPKAAVTALTATTGTITTLAATTAALTSATIASATIASLNLGDDLLVLKGDGEPVDYTDGDPEATGEGLAGIGSLYIDYTNGKLYINGGTKAQPTWKLVTSAA